MNLTVVILAAGRGKRMKSAVPKVIHEALGNPMLQHVIDAVKTVKPSKTVVVIGNGADQVRKRVVGDHLTFVLQKKLLGTGDALAIARKEIKKGTVLVLNGDCPLITPKTLKTVLTKHRKNKNTLSILSFIDSEMSGYGRILRNGQGKMTGIVEDKHATVEERERFNELNGGVYLIETEALRLLDRIKKNSSSGEFYLTDIVGIIADSGKKLDAYNCPSEDIRGVNSRQDLYEITDILRRRYIRKLMDKGVTFIDPDTSMVQPSVSVGSDTVIYPNTYLEGSTSIGKNCVIYPGVRICDSRIGDDVIVKDSTLVEDSKVAKGAVLGPFAHLRPGSVIGSNSRIGNFVEIKKSRLGKGTKASHLSYLGDAHIEDNVNIGAGTITCNYDGKNKFRTTIKKDVFIGSDTQLVAPVTVGKGAYVAAGATVTKDVPSGSLAISRSKQRNLDGWAKKKTVRPKRNKSKKK